jgi:hypothetical protein
MIIIFNQFRCVVFVCFVSFTTRSFTRRILFEKESEIVSKNVRT